MPWAKLQFSLLLLGVYANYCFKIFLSEWLSESSFFSPILFIGHSLEKRGDTNCSPSPVCVGVCTVPVGYFREASKWSPVYFYIITPFSCEGKKWWLRCSLCSAVWSQKHWFTFSGSRFRTSLPFREQSTSGSAGAIIVSLAKNILLVAVSTDAWCYYY